MTIIKIVNRMLDMCPEAWYIFIRSIQLTAFMLLCAFVLLLESSGRHDLYMTAFSLYETGQIVILLGAICSVCIEDFQS